MPNKDLVNKKYRVPEEIIKQLVLYKSLPGYEMLSNLIKNPTLSYSLMYKFKNKLENNKNNIEIYNSYGGNVLYNWIINTLETDMNISANRKAINTDIGLTNQYRKEHQKNTHAITKSHLKEGNIKRIIISEEFAKKYFDIDF